MKPKIYKYAIVEKGAKIGLGTVICSFCYIEKGVIIGRNCKIKNGVQIFNGVEIGDDVFIGAGTIFTNVKKPRAFTRSVICKTIIESKVTIGANVTILPNVWIHRNSLVGAGAVVTKNVPANCIVVGNPAKPISR